MNKNKKPELLAPAGSPESAYAAFSHGADAIYLGLSRFSARADATNFTREALSESIGFAHAQEKPRKVYVAVNTLVQDAELPDLLPMLEMLEDLRADAVIVQDMGVARIIRQHFPGLALHASTQMAIHNREGAMAAMALGISRVVLARELTLPELSDIAQNSGVETEAFIHGALCYSMSGLCLYSSFATGRSANRGSCAYPCRDQFSGEGLPSGHIFSMKDMALDGDVAKLAEAGITSLKIEGRKKGPLYTAAVTDYYRNILDGTASPKELAEKAWRIKTIFSRNQTRLYLENRRAKNVVSPHVVGPMGGELGRVAAIVNAQGRTWLRFIPTHAIERHDGLQIPLPGEEKPFGFAVMDMRLKGKSVFNAPAGQVVELALPAGAPTLAESMPVYVSSSQAAQKAYPFPIPRPGAFRSRMPVSIRLSLTHGRIDAEALLADGSAASLSVVGDLPPAQTPEGMETACRKAFEKCGDTPFSLETLSFLNPDGLFVPAAQLNDIRRRLLAELEEAHAKNRAETRAAVLAGLGATQPETLPASPGYLLSVDNAADLQDFEEADREGVSEILLPLDSATPETLQTMAHAWPNATLRISLPTLCRAWETQAIQKHVESLIAAGQTRWDIQNLWGWEMLHEKAGLDLSAGWPLYALNTAAVSSLMEMGFSRITLSPEDSQENARTLLARFPGRIALPVYMTPPLFISETCPVPASGASCPSGCKGGISDLRSRHGNDLRLIRKGCRSFVCSVQSRCVIESLAGLPPLLRLADFTLSGKTPAEIVQVWRLLRRGKAPKGTTLWNWKRGFLK
ncbi:MAG TPA: hypothetical protein DCW68_07570 [Rhodospirillaceae bacterium]|nr:MAG: hypothetical protein A2018_08210 [Alphaproteobacteria bacterium GWF2_58_20]HAU29945.1 hypothetical protein [Rhodospirillaceae bacterium]